MLVRCLNFNWGRRAQHLVNYESDEDTPLALRLIYRKRKSQSPGGLKRQLLQEQEEKLCVVCLTNNKCVILMPCRHLCMCTDCSDVIDNTSRLCPICRTDFDRRVTVYM
jgi:Zinc finger, C3HC4 type (RING finger)